MFSNTVDAGAMGAFVGVSAVMSVVGRGVLSTLGEQEKRLDAKRDERISKSIVFFHVGTFKYFFVFAFSGIIVKNRKQNILLLNYFGLLYHIQLNNSRDNNKNFIKLAFLMKN